MSLKSEGGTQAQDPLVALEAEINDLKGKIKKLEDQYSEEELSKHALYLSHKAELIELRKEKNLIRASATSTAQQGK